MQNDLDRKTKETAGRLFSKGPRPPYHLWKEFDPSLANDLSRFITGNLYSRDILPLPERQMVACISLASLRAGEELRLHLHAALNVGCDIRKLAEAIFQIAPYAGMPAVNEALSIYREVPAERGLWPIHDNNNER